MPLNAVQVVPKVFDFDSGDIGRLVADSSASGATQLEPPITGEAWGASASLSGANDNAFVYGKDVAQFDIDKLHCIEFLMRLATWNDDAIAYAGAISAYNATPGNIAEKALFVIGGGTNGRDVGVQTDDGTTDSGVVTPTPAIEIPEDDDFRVEINFKTGIVTMGPPNRSAGGKSAVQFYSSNNVGEMRKLVLDTQMDMSGYSGSLQVFFGVDQSGGTPGTPTVYCKQITVKYEVP